MGKMNVVAGVALLVGLAVVGWQAITPTASQRGHSMTPPNTSTIPAGEKIVGVKLPKQLSADAALGKRMFDVKCAACHGENAAGQNGVAPPLVHKIYEPSHHSDAAFVSAAQNGVRSHHWRFGSMPAVEGLTRSDVLLIARYVRELQRENGIN